TSMKKLSKLFEFIEMNPIIDTTKTAAELGFSYNTTAKYIDLLCQKGILRQTSKFGKANIYSYEDYLSILRKDT
nr:Fic family protein [Clostridiales bacterium]